MNNSCNVIVLAAGESLRFGKDKAFLCFDENHSFIQWIVSVYSKVIPDKLTVVVNPLNAEKIIDALADINADVQIIVNEDFKLDRSYSIKRAFDFIGYDLPCFIQNVDNPFVKEELLREMLDNIAVNGWVRPVFQGKGGHPILLGSACLKSILMEFSTEIPLKNLLRKYQRIDVKTQDSKILGNLNTMEDYLNYFPASTNNHN